MNVFIQKAVEYLDEQSNSNQEGENTDSYQTALDWEATTA
jgi:hypothetical protein